MSIAILCATISEALLRLGEQGGDAEAALADAVRLIEGMAGR